MCRAEEPLRRSHVAGLAQHRVNEVTVAIDRSIQVAPAALDLQVGFIDIPTFAIPAAGAMVPLAQCLAHYGEQLRLPPPDALMADGEPTQKHDLAEILSVSL